MPSTMYRHYCEVDLSKYVDCPVLSALSTAVLHPVGIAVGLTSKPVLIVAVYVQCLQRFLILWALMWG